MTLPSGEECGFDVMRSGIALLPPAMVPAGGKGTTGGIVLVLKAGMLYLHLISPAGFTPSCSRERRGKVCSFRGELEMNP